MIKVLVFLLSSFVSILLLFLTKRSVESIYLAFGDDSLLGIFLVCLSSFIYFYILLLGWILLEPALKKLDALSAYNTLNTIGAFVVVATSSAYLFIIFDFYSNSPSDKSELFQKIMGFSFIEIIICFLAVVASIPLRESREKIYAFFKDW